MEPTFTEWAAIRALRKEDEQALSELTQTVYNLFGCNKDDFTRLARTAVRYYSGSAILRSQMRQLQNLEQAWYTSVRSGTPNYALYDDVFIIADVFACWVVYSRGYLQSCQSPKSLGDRSILSMIGEPHCIVDVGCGIGFTAKLKTLFPTAQVYGTNLKNTKQYEICKHVAQAANFLMVENIAEVPDAIDLVFASEYFEHFENPRLHAETIFRRQPRYALIANSFGSTSFGHFELYEGIPGKQYGRIFNTHLRTLGYQKIPTKNWNGRPAFWKYA